MPSEPRKLHPPVQNTSAGRNGPYRALQRRLRQTIGEIEWLDVTTSVVLGAVLDALWGEWSSHVLSWLLQALRGFSR